MVALVVILSIVTVICIISSIVIILENNRLEAKLDNLESDKILYKNLFEKERKYTEQLKAQVEEALSRIEDMKKKEVKPQEKKTTKKTIKTESKTTTKRRKVAKEEK